MSREQPPGIVLRVYPRLVFRGNVDEVERMTNLKRLSQNLKVLLAVVLRRSAAPPPFGAPSPGVVN